MISSYIALIFLCLSIYFDFGVYASYSFKVVRIKEELWDNHEKVKGIIQFMKKSMKMNFISGYEDYSFIVAINDEYFDTLSLHFTKNIINNNNDDDDDNDNNNGNNKKNNKRNLIYDKTTLEVNEVFNNVLFSNVNPTYKHNDVYDENNKKRRNLMVKKKDLSDKKNEKSLYSTYTIWTSDNLLDIKNKIFVPLSLSNEFLNSFYIYHHNGPIKEQGKHMAIMKIKNNNYKKKIIDILKSSKHILYVEEKELFYPLTLEAIRKCLHGPSNKFNNLNNNNSFLKKGGLPIHQKSSSSKKNDVAKIINYGKSSIVTVLDTGLDYNHCLFKDNKKPQGPLKFLATEDNWKSISEKILKNEGLKHDKILGYISLGFVDEIEEKTLSSDDDDDDDNDAKELNDYSANLLIEHSILKESQKGIGHHGLYSEKLEDRESKISNMFSEYGDLINNNNNNNDDGTINNIYNNNKVNNNNKKALAFRVKKTDGTDKRNGHGSHVVGSAVGKFSKCFPIKIDSKLNKIVPDNDDNNNKNNDDNEYSNNDDLLLLNGSCKKYKPDDSKSKVGQMFFDMISDSVTLYESDAKVLFIDIEKTPDDYFFYNKTNKNNTNNNDDDDDTPLSIPDSISWLLELSHSLGSKIMSNSWGSSRNGYSFSSYEMDYFIHLHPDYTILMAAGNNGPLPYTISSPAGAKNVITVGSSLNTYDSYNYYTKKDIPLYFNASFDIKHINKYFELYNDDILSSFSSRGPCFDGRIKPDIVFPGQMILSARASGYNYDLNCKNIDNKNNDEFFQMMGTSMATPLLSNIIVFMDYILKSKYGVEKPSSSLRKSLLATLSTKIKPSYTTKTLSSKKTSSSSSTTTVKLNDTISAKVTFINPETNILNDGKVYLTTTDLDLKADPYITKDILRESRKGNGENWKGFFEKAVNSSENIKKPEISKLAKTSPVNDFKQGFGLVDMRPFTDEDETTSEIEFIDNINIQAFTKPYSFCLDLSSSKLRYGKYYDIKDPLHDSLSISMAYDDVPSMPFKDVTFTADGNPDNYKGFTGRGPGLLNNIHFRAVVLNSNGKEVYRIYNGNHKEFDDKINNLEKITIYKISDLLFGLVKRTTPEFSRKKNDDDDKKNKKKDNDDNKSNNDNKPGKLYVKISLASNGPIISLRQNLIQNQFVSLSWNRGAPLSDGNDGILLYTNNDNNKNNDKSKIHGGYNKIDLSSSDDIIKNSCGFECTPYDVPFQCMLKKYINDGDVINNNEEEDNNNKNNNNNNNGDNIDDIIKKLNKLQNEKKKYYYEIGYRPCKDDGTYDMTKCMSFGDNNISYKKNRDYIKINLDNGTNICIPELCKNNNDTILNEQLNNNTIMSLECCFTLFNPTLDNPGKNFKLNNGRKLLNDNNFINNDLNENKKIKISIFNKLGIISFLLTVIIYFSYLSIKSSMLNKINKE